MPICTVPPHPVDNCATEHSEVVGIFAPRSLIGKSQPLFTAATAQTVSDKFFNVEALLVTVHRSRKATEVTAISQVCASASIGYKFIEVLWAGVGINLGFELMVMILHLKRLQGPYLQYGGSAHQLRALGYELLKNGRFIL